MSSFTQGFLRQKGVGAMYLYQDLSEKIIGCAINVHKSLGPGFLEQIYEEAMAHELSYERIAFACQLPVSITYRNRIVGLHKVDLLVENKIVVELKAVRAIDDIHFAIMRSYLKATKIKLGLILNFSQLTVVPKRVVRDKALWAKECQSEGTLDGDVKKIAPVHFVMDNMSINNQIDSQGRGANAQKSGISNQQLEGI